MANGRGLAGHDWALSYRTSDTSENGAPVDILRDFYIPALSRSIHYDRVAGYFRSSSLAAASVGYSAFIGRGGRMRLIVGADLDPVDVCVILSGDQQRMEHCLSRELRLDQPIPQDVRNGLTLLSWMVAEGIMEIRVAFRRDRVTLQPLPFDSVADGYVHEKWLIFGDEFGQRLYCSGSLNESKTALVLNAENIDLHADWDGGKEQQRVDKACYDFEELWNNRRPHIPVLTLPDAVRAKLIRLSQEAAEFFELDGTPIFHPALVKPSAMEMLQFAVIQDAPLMPGGQFVGMYTAPVEPWPHQEIVIRRLIQTYPYSYLLCDEVGLGKTIEAGLAIRSLYLAGMAHRILIAAPASLTNQWQREMMYKAVLPFARTTAVGGIKRNYLDPALPEPEDKGLYSPNLNIISTGILARKERRKEIRRAKPFDIVLVDEAHYARRQNPAAGTSDSPEYGQLYDTLHSEVVGKARSLWLATATPMQIDPIEVYDLIALTRRVGAYIEDPSLTGLYFRILGRLIGRGVISKDEWEVIARTLRQMEVQDPYHHTFIQNTSMRTAVVRNALNQLLSGRRNLPRADWPHLAKPLFTASPLSRVMQRHTRELLKIYRLRGELNRKLAERVVLPIRKIVFTRAERTCYEQLKEYCDGLSMQIAENSDRQTRQVMFFLLSFLRLRFASSLYAITQTLRRRRKRVLMTLRTGGRTFQDEKELAEYLAGIQAEEDDDSGEDEIEIDFELLLKNRSTKDLEWERDQLNAMLTDLEQLHERPSKMQALLEVIQHRDPNGSGRVRQMVVFTRFMDTLRDIYTNLVAIRPDFHIGIYSGSETQFYDAKSGRMYGTNAEEVKRHFLSGNIDILLCTDAAAEGLNLQTADLIVNYDLGWNPMKIEQRIGRIDRIGQLYDQIYVLNFCYLGSAEEIVYGRLLQRLSDANLVVGAQQISILPVEAEDFQKLEEGKLSEEELEEKAKRLIKEQKARQESMELRAEDQYEMYRTMSALARQQQIPITLEEIWQTFASSTFLQKLGIRLDPDQPEVLMVDSLAGADFTSRATISRDLFERTAGLRFLTYGEPLLDLLIQTAIASTRPWPNCAKRISAPVEAFPGMECIGYVIAYKAVCGTEMRLITSLAQLRGIELDEGTDIADADLTPFVSQLAKLSKESLEENLTCLQVPVYNEKAARLHHMLLDQVAACLLSTACTENNERFWPLLQELILRVHSMDSVSIQMDVRPFREYQNTLLFDLHIPPIGDEHIIGIPSILASLSLEHASRVADSLKKKKAELAVEEVLRKLKVD